MTCPVIGELEVAKSFLYCWVDSTWPVLSTWNKKKTAYFAFPLNFIWPLRFLSINFTVTINYCINFTAKNLSWNANLLKYTTIVTPNINIFALYLILAFDYTVVIFRNNVGYITSYFYIVKIWVIFYIHLKNSLIIHEENTKKNHKRVVSLYVIYRVAQKMFPLFDSM